MKKYGALGLFFSAAFFVCAMDWPVREGRIFSNFGNSDGGVPLLGTAFGSSGPVYPADVGQLIFVHDPENPGARMPSPLGSWMAVDHGDNMVGLYGRYEDRQNSPVPAVVEKNTVLASSGMTGWTEQTGLYFAFFDRRERRWVNPQMIISGREDTSAPVIRQVELRNTAGTVFNPAQVQRLPQGLYTVFADVSDTGSGGEMLAPNRITCSVNGVETGVLSFETLASRNGRRMVYRQGFIPAADVYSPRGFGLGEIRLSRGQAVIIIETRDMADNVRSASYRITVD